MKLEIGKAAQVRFARFLIERNMFSCCANGLVLEWAPKTDMITLFVTNSDYNAVYAVAELCTKKSLKKKKVLVVGRSENVMMFDGGDLLVMVDFAGKKVAVNRPEIRVMGKGDWGTDVQRPWESSFNTMFALREEEPEEAPAEATQPDADTAERFWAWFAGTEEELVDKILAGGVDQELMMAKIRARLASVFPYEKPENIEFQVGGDGEKNELAVFHLNAEPLKTDAERLGEKMPESLTERWSFHAEA